MEKITRHRKAFYEKENDYKNNGNIKLQFSKNLPSKYKTNYPTLHNTQSYQSLFNFKSSETFEKKPIRDDTEYYCTYYTLDILHSPQNSDIPKRFLNNHKIDFNLRARMLDWMVEVMTSYKFVHKTYFAAVQIMDRYFQKENEQLYPTSLHALGIISMMIASKMQQVYPLKLKTIYEKISHKKISEQQIIGLEQKISYKLNYKLNSWTFFDLAIAKVHIYMQLLNKRRHGTINNFANNYYFNSQSEANITEQIRSKLNQIQDVCSYICKFLIYDYQFYCSHSLNFFSDVVLKLTFEILKIPCQLDLVCKSSQIEIELCKEQLIERIQKFDFKFKGLNNLKKFTNQQVVKLVECNQ